MATIQIGVPTILPARPRAWLPGAAFALYAAVQLALWGPGWDARSALMPSDPAFIQEWAIRDLALSLGRFAVAIAFVALPRTRVRRMLAVAVLTGLSAIAFAIHVPGIPASVSPIGLMWQIPGHPDAMPLAALAGVGAEAVLLAAVALLIRRRDHASLPDEHGPAAIDALPAVAALGPFVYGVMLLHPLEWSSTYTLMFLGVAAAYGYARRYESPWAVIGPSLALALIRMSTAIADMVEFGLTIEAARNIAVLAMLVLAGPVAALAARSLPLVRDRGPGWVAALCAAWAVAGGMAVSAAFVIG